MSSTIKKQTIEQLNKTIESTAPVEPDLRMVQNIEVGQWIHQGDIAIERVEKAQSGEKVETMQLAPGNTKGSRHILADFKGKIQQPNGNDLLGPSFTADERFTLTHPEHAHYSLPAGDYQVRYQRNHEMEEIARVRD